GGYLDALREGPQRVLKKHYDCLRKCGRFYRPKVRGECTASYARLEGEVIDEIVALNPALRAILMVRDPVERAWSHAKKALLRGPGRSVEELAQEEFAKFVRSSGQRRLANYSGMIEAWRSRLGPEKLYLGDYRRIATDPKGLLGEMHGFLGVDRGERYFNRHLRERINATGKEAMPEAFEELLRGYLADEIAGFEEVLAEVG
ncbi:MAG: sulfotransferase domain-containing protein, partial [Verrucomicrobiales bacterium]